MIVLKDRQLHFDGLADSHTLVGQRTLCFHIVVNGHLKGAEGLGVADILQVEHEVLAPTDLRVHPQVVGLHNLPAVELVPQHAVIEVRGVFHHVGGVFLPGHQAVIIDIALLGDPLAHHPVEVGDNQVAGPGFRGPDQRAGGVGSDPVITVQKLKISALGLVEGGVPGVGDAGVFLVDDPNPGIPGGICVADGTGTVGAAVVDQQQLKVGVLLVQNALNTAADGVFSVIDRDDDADGGGHKHGSFWGSCSFILS